MSLSLDRLRQWQQQAGVVQPERPSSTSTATEISAPTTPEPCSLDTAFRLQRVLAARLHDARSRALPRHPSNTERLRIPPGEEIAPGLWLQQDWLAQPWPSAPISLAFAKRLDEIHDPRSLLFFDTETTGLNGGVGTRAFMIGTGDWSVDAYGRPGLRVRQLTLGNPSAESAMLQTFASWLNPNTVLSSFNGRCYDVPLLKARYRLARLRDPLSTLDHIDLLFPARRFWRGRWENCRLATLERHLLGIVREDDLPGSEAPRAWLSYLCGGDARDLHRVARHNHQDVVSLAALLVRLVSAQQQTIESVARLLTQN